MTSLIRTRRPRRDTAHVFLHGSPGRSADWDAVAADAPDAFLVFVDLPDHGDAPPSEVDLAGLEQAALDAVRSVEAPRLRLVGHSFGAWLAARLADRLPTVERLTLVAGLPDMPAEALELRRGLADQIEAGALGEAEVNELAVGMLLGAEHRTAATEAATRDLAASVPLQRWPRLLRRTLDLASPGLAVRGYAAPAVLVHGLRDGAVPFALGEALAGLGRDTRMVPVETDSHMLQLTHPEVVARAAFG